MTLTRGNFEWDSEKSKTNKEKHGLSFEEILDIFDDPYFFEIFDSQHSNVDEDRYIGVGRRKKQLVVVVVYTQRNEKQRIITARNASSKERRLYYEQIGKNYFSM